MRHRRVPIRSLSGGEKARFYWQNHGAESNLLVLDEPTNDLDVETLDLLQELLDDYDGTVILVSHDRDFLDRVATATWRWKGTAAPRSMQVGGAIINRKSPKRTRKTRG